MKLPRTEQAIEMMIGIESSWIKPFIIGEYLHNAPMIEKLYQEKQQFLLEATELKSQVDKLNEEVHRLDKMNEATKIKLGEASSRANLVFSLSLLATLLISIGVNVVTSSNQVVWIGWMMIISGCLLEVLAFLYKS